MLWAVLLANIFGVFPTEPPLWDGDGARLGEGVAPASNWDEADQVAPAFEVKQRISFGDGQNSGMTAVGR
jgi:hypothetical protein